MVGLQREFDSDRGKRLGQESQKGEDAIFAEVPDGQGFTRLLERIQVPSPVDAVDFGLQVGDHRTSTATARDPD